MEKKKRQPVAVRKKTEFFYIKKNSSMLLLALPALIYFIVFHYIPMFGAVIAFKDYSYVDGILGSRWIGLENFKFFFASQDAVRVTRNTVCYGTVFIIMNAVCAAAVALLMNEIRSRRAIKAYQTVMLFPNFLSWVVVGYISYVLLNPELGTFNQILGAFGKKGIDWYSDPKYWPFILTVANTWKGVGMQSIIYYATLLGVDASLYEAATIDGANRWQQCRYISLPSLSPVIIIMSILAVGNILRGDMGLYYQLSRDVGALYPTTDVIDTYLYRGLRTGDMGITAAVGLFQSVVGTCMVLLTNGIVKKIDPDQITKTVTSIQKVIELIGGLSGGSSAASLAKKSTGDPLFDKRFDEWF